jgi:dienelactone hydrolase
VTDIYGIVTLQSKLLADSMAAAGYFVVMPDIFNKDIPAENKPLDFPVWGPKHPPSEADTILTKTIATMRGNYGVKRIGSVGYCWGGRFTIRQLAQNKAIDAGFVAHPTQVEAGEFSAIAGPLSIAAAESDAQFNTTKRRETEDILQKKGSAYQINLYSGTQHGFAVSVDVKDKKKAFAKQAAFSQAIRWFDEWVKE